MLLDNQEAARVAKQFGCTACTDVTGFGLIGHLVEMLEYAPSGGSTATATATATTTASAVRSNAATKQRTLNDDDDDDDDYDYDDYDFDEAETGAACSTRPARPCSVARLNMAAIPFLPGAEHVVSSGVVSSLQPDNLRSARAVRDSAKCQAAFGAAYQLLFDPQTAGGLLCAVPTASAATCVAALRAAGYVDASDIGTVNTPEPHDGSIHSVNLV
jgi:selenide,water dikinase